MTIALASESELRVQEALDLQGGRILVVDDDDDFREITRRTLERHGARVRTASSPDAAVEACTEERPDLVLMDVWMPNASGIQSCRRFAEHPATAGVPIVLMSGQWRDEVQLYRALALGASDVVAKERNASELVARVKAALVRRSASALAEVAAACQCGRVRDAEGAWETLTERLERLGSGALVTPCPECER